MEPLGKGARRQRFLPLFSFLIPFCLMTVLLYTLDVYPFGDKTLLVSDMNNQYIGYFSYYKTLFGSGNDFFYTFSKNLGGDMTGFGAYYLFSPFNLIFLLFPDPLLPVAAALVIVLKLSLCGLTFSCFLNATNAPKARSLIFSTTYALMGYNMAYLFNVMWLDGVALLPLVALGIYRIVAEKRWILYTFSLCAALISNYYIGFMLCLFSVLYFLYRMSATLRSFSDVKKHGGTLGIYGAASLAAGGLAAFVLLPAFESLKGGKASFSPHLLDFSENYPFMDVFSKLYVNSTDWNQIASGLPVIFCGMLVVVSVCLYFLNAKIRLRDKLLSAGILVVLLACFHVSAFNLIWHGLNPPSWFPYRYSFVFTFLLISIGYSGMLNAPEGLGSRQFTLCGTIFAVSTLLILRNQYDFIHLKSVYLDVFLVLLFCLLFYGLRVRPGAKRAILLVLALLQLTELSVNAYNSISMLQAAASSTMSSYNEYVRLTAPVIRRIQDGDEGLYRMEKTFHRMLNDPMLFNYKGLSHFSSTEKTFVKSFMGKLGFRDNENWAKYGLGSTCAADCLLGVKYLLSRQSGIHKPYEKLFAENGITAFQNPYALPFGFGVSDGVLTTKLETLNVFEVQNTIFQSMTGNTEEDLFIPAAIAGVTCDNLTATIHDGFTRYQKIDQGAEAYVHYQLRISNGHALYAYLTAPHFQNTEIFANGASLGKYFDVYRWEIVSLGSFPNAGAVTFSVKVNDASIDISDAYFYFEDIGVLERSYAVLASQACLLEEMSSSHIKGTITVPQDGPLLFSIPYEDGWRFYVDGKQMNKIMVFGALMAVEVSAGTHRVELRYIPGGLYSGVGISALTFMSILAILLVLSIKRRKEARLQSVLPAGGMAPVQQREHL